MVLNKNHGNVHNNVSMPALSEVQEQLVSDCENPSLLQLEMQEAHQASAAGCFVRRGVFSSPKIEGEVASLR